MRDAESIVIGDLELRPHERSVIAAGAAVPLTCGELEILTALAEHPGWVLSADDLTSDPDEHEHSPESVSVLVSRLRQKLATAGAPDVIETVRGFGYRLHASGDTSAAGLEAGDRTLRDAAWQLLEAVFEIERSGTVEQRAAAAHELERTRRAIYGRLAE